MRHQSNKYVLLFFTLILLFFGRLQSQKLFEREIKILSNGSLGLQLNAKMDITGFSKDTLGQRLPAEASGGIFIGDKVIGINSIHLIDLPFLEAIEILQNQEVDDVNQ